ncbi:MAG: hypothetical protein JNK30_11285 [Phenylobacterium sp.]|uniref:hypothetical protein n=1 Tax=Phenylobacterium sp. TaxID=1871053 RepID=UPI001A4DB9DF|nr:hypothetical protein [Phenylobacterium sp.]MBL8771955.1 hypothetical protein [Phenylobacterium sp.]
MSPVTGPIATGVALALALAYGVSASMWRSERAGYEARIVELAQASNATHARLRTDLAACHAARAAPPAVVAEVGPDAQTPAGARRLLQQGPEGIDACARMESADRAVLSNLKE